MAKATKAPKTAKKQAAKPAPKAAKPAAKAAAKPAKAASKPAAKPVAKAVAKPAAKPVSKPVTARAAQPVALHPVPTGPRNNAPTPKWMSDAIRYAQANPAVMLVSIIAAVVGLMLIFS